MAATRIPPNWEPKMTPIEIITEYPFLGSEADAKATLRAFIDLHLGKGDTSHDWDATFRGFCDYRHRMARIEADKQRHTDSMGLPLKGLSNQPPPVNDGGLRFLDQYEKHRKNGLDAEAARAAALTDLQGDADE